MSVQMYIVECDEDHRLCLLYKNEMICDFESLDVGDHVGFMYDRKMYGGEVTHIGDEKDMCEEFLRLTVQDNNMIANLKDQKTITKSDGSKSKKIKGSQKSQTQILEEQEEQLNQGLEAIQRKMQSLGTPNQMASANANTSKSSQSADKSSSVKRASSDDLKNSNPAPTKKAKIMEQEENLDDSHSSTVLNRDEKQSANNSGPRKSLRIKSLQISKDVSSAKEQLETYDSDSDSNLGSGVGNSKIRHEGQGKMITQKKNSTMKKILKHSTDMSDASSGNEDFDMDLSSDSSAGGDNTHRTKKHGTKTIPSKRSQRNAMKIVAAVHEQSEAQMRTSQIVPPVDADDEDQEFTQQVTLPLQEEQNAVAMEQLFGEFYPHSKMSHIGDGIFCKAESLDYAMYSSFAGTECSRRILVGTFHLEALLNYNMTPRNPPKRRAQNRERAGTSSEDADMTQRNRRSLHGRAVNAITSFTLKHTNVTMKDEWKPTTASDVRAAMQQCMRDVRKNYDEAQERGEEYLYGFDL